MLSVTLVAVLSRLSPVVGTLVLSICIVSCTRPGVAAAEALGSFC